MHACGGYDPESKGKVEAGVKYITQDALYGDIFCGEVDLSAHLQQWLDEVANVRTHGTTFIGVDNLVDTRAHPPFAGKPVAHRRLVASS